MALSHDAKTHLAHDGSSINALAAISGTNFFLSGGGSDGLVKIHQITDSISTIPLPKTHSNSVNSLDYRQQHFLSASSDGYVCVWDLNSQQPVLKSAPKRSKDCLLSCKFLSENLYITCGSDHRIDFYDTRRDYSFHSVSVGLDNLNSCDFDPASNTIYAGSSDGAVYSLDLRNEKLNTFEYADDRGGVLDVFHCAGLGGHLVTFESSVVFQKNDNYEDLLIDVACAQDTVKFNSEIFPDFHKSGVFHMVSGSSNGTLNYWHFNTTLQKKSFAVSDDIVNIVKFDKSANRLILSIGGGRVCVLENFI